MNIPHALAEAHETLTTALTAEHERIGQRNNWTVTLDKVSTDAVTQYSVALRDVTGTRQEFVRRAGLIATMTTDGTSFANAWSAAWRELSRWQAPRPLWEDSPASLPPNNWRVIIEQARGTGLLDIVHLESITQHAALLRDRGQETAKLATLAAQAQSVITAARKAHTEGCRTLLLLATTQAAPDDADLQPLLDTLPDVDAARQPVHTPVAPMQMLKAVGSLMAWIREQPDPDEPDPESGGMRVSEAAEISGINSGIISRAVGAGKLKSNGRTGHDRRIDAVDFAR